MSRQNISSNSHMEPKIGMSRAVRIGNSVAIAGTAPIPQDGSALPSDVYEQTKLCIEISLNALATAGGAPTDVIRTRMMLTDISQWQAAARAHGEVFGDIRPVCTFVEISAFVDPAWLVETEMDAVIE